MTNWTDTTKNTTSYTQETKNSTSSVYQDMEAQSLLKIDNTFLFLIDSTYNLLLGDSTTWNLQTKN